jgi:peptidoglycan/xylan/chitin deacetylase (PgdA/CDA1 family)
VWRGTNTRKVIALTFDDGPSESTPGLLDLLHRHSASATFFQCGANAERLPDIARAVSNRGHEIGNHTYSHAPLWLRQPRFVASEVSRAQVCLERIHTRPPRYFRPPYGVRWFGLRGAQRAHGLLSVMWTAIAADWKLPAGDIVQRLLARVRPGAIFCLHDGRAAAVDPDIRNTVEAVEQLLPALQRRGYRLETVSQILCPTP